VQIGRSRTAQCSDALSNTLEVLNDNALYTFTFTFTYIHIHMQTGWTLNAGSVEGWG